jgi:glycosyltransferase involved in cell wall biosynthesis
MRVGIDVTPLRQTSAGTAKHLDGLLPALEARPGLALRRFSFAVSGRLGVLALDTGWYPLGLPLEAARARVDVLHCPTQRAPLTGRVPLVVTIHDLAVLRHPELFNGWTRRYSAFAVPRVVRAARRVIAVSEFTRDELVRLLRVPEEKVRVVPNGLGGAFGPEGPRAEGDYVLAVGTLEPRKNLPRLVEAARLAGVELRVVGARGWGGVEVGGAGVRWLGPLPEDEVAALVRGARCLAYPSLYEGFGLPVLEAMACGTPVVTSRGGATEETAGGAAVLVDPLDPAAIAAGIAQAQARRDELRALGLARARAFTWEAAAAATHRVYEEVAA